MTESFPNRGHADDAIRVLFVEDDKEYREAIGGELSQRGFLLQNFGDGASLFASLELEVDAHIIILAWQLPKTRGVDLLPRLRLRGVNLPVVFLTDHTLPANESLALQSGAIDFIDRARGIEVLVRRLVRIREVSKSAADGEAKVCGKLSLRPNVSRAYWNGVDVGLTLGEYNIVHLLASNVGKYVTYRAIYDRLRHEGFIAGEGAEGYRANVRSAIKRIRNGFRALDPTFDNIENYASFGYCWKKPA
jgi:two-component system, OmpR family, response regulator ChvI